MIGMKEEFAEDIKQELNDGRSMEARRAAAEAITSDSGVLEQEIHDTAQETYKIEMAKWEVGDKTQKLTTIREDGEEAYKLRQTSSNKTTSSEITVADNADADSIDSADDFRNFIDSLKQENSTINPATELEDEYAISGAYRND